MNKNTILSKSIAAAASLVILASAAHAATLVNGTSGAGELFIGFRASSGVGASQNIVIDVGSASALAALAPGSVVSLGNIGADLSSATTGFGANWFDRTDLKWSAVSGNNGTDIATRTLYGSVSGTGSFPLSTAGYTRAGSTTQNGIVGTILSMASGAQGFTAATQGSSSNVAVETVTGVAGDNSWNTKFGASPFGGFGAPSGQVFEQAFTAGTLASGVEGALDVYRMVTIGTTDPDTGLTSGAGSYQITLAINSSGDITGEVLPVPEPASIGMLTSLALFGVGTLRRKRGAKA